MNVNETQNVYVDQENWKKYLKTPLLVIVVAIAASLPTSILSALLYRFPFFMVGSQSGIDAALDAPLMWVIWIAFGGFVVLGVLGLIAGLLIAIRIKNNSLRKKYAIWTGALIAVVSVLIFASSDLIFGPW
jgi:hypothetical protein